MGLQSGEKIALLLDSQLPEVWELNIDEASALAVSGALHRGQVVRLVDLIRIRVTGKRAALYSVIAKPSRYIHGVACG